VTLKWRKRLLVLVGVAAALLIFCLCFTFVFYRDWAFICENTGSRKGYREWCFGHQTGRWYQHSAVEIFMQEKFPDELKHRWTSYAGTGRNIFGVKLLYGHGRPGPLIQISQDRLNEWFAPLPDTEKKAFSELLVNADDKTIDEKIESIYDDLYNSSAK